MSLRGAPIWRLERRPASIALAALALDDTSVYWAVSDSIKSAPRDGGDAVTIVSSLTNPHALAVDADNLDFTQETGGVWRVAKHAR